MKFSLNPVLLAIALGLMSLGGCGEPDSPVAGEALEGTRPANKAGQGQQQPGPFKR